MIHTQRSIGTVLLIAAAPGGCATHAPQGAAVYVRAKVAPDPAPSPALIVRASEPVPASSQLRPMPGRPKATGAFAPGAPNLTRPSPLQVVADANRKASQAPASSDTFNAIVQYSYEAGTLFQVFAAPMRITDIALEPGEKILGQPASGDVVRWLLAMGKSMDHGVEQWHVYLKPTRPDLETNLAINTDRRSYMLELHSYADTYMAAVVWRYPEEELARLQREAADLATEEKTTAPVVGIDALNFNYTIEVIQGSPAWTPVQAFDDGRRTFVRFPQAMLEREAPALFVLRGNETELVNYRVKGDTYVIDRLFDSAELRVGQHDQEIVRIARGGIGSPAAVVHGRAGL
ncbi:MAG: P-type conjugative transfer protein TrbG [Polyangiaceae bacterium]